MTNDQIPTTNQMSDLVIGIWSFFFLARLALTDCLSIDPALGCQIGREWVNILRTCTGIG